MAYRAFDEWPLAPVADLTAEPIESTEAEVPFSALELRVIALSGREPASSIEAPSKLDSFLAKLFAIRLAKPLADPRLEALRRFAILARTAGDRLADREVNAFIRAGFSRVQARWLRRSAPAALFAR